MAQQVLQVNFIFDGTLDEALGEFAPMVQPIADQPGLKWKVWCWNDEAREFAGEYLFGDAAAVKGYLSGPIVAALQKHPKIGSLSAKVFDVIEEASKATRAPL